MVVWDAVVLAGGRGTRLGGVDKANVRVGDRSLLERTMGALSQARRVVLVGDVEAPDAVTVREDPPFAGPAAAIGAGLAEVTAPWTLITGVDHPFLADAVTPLLEAATRDGAVALDVHGRRQHLLCVVRSDAVRAAAAAQATLDGLAVHVLMKPLDLAEIAVPERATRDVDTWDDRDEVEHAAGSDWARQEDTHG